MKAVDEYKNDLPIPFGCSRAKYKGKVAFNTIY